MIAHTRRVVTYVLAAALLLAGGWLSILQSLGGGVLLGGVFVVMKLPAPAPPVFAGVAGIIGVWLGYTVAASLLGVLGK